MMKETPNQEQRLIRITYQKPTKDGIAKREIVLTGYHGLVIITLAVLAISTILILSGTEIF